MNMIPGYLELILAILDAIRMLIEIYQNAR